MKLILKLASLIPVGCIVAWSADVTFSGSTPLQWSERLAQSEIKRLGTGLEQGGSNPKARWEYSPAVLAFGLVRLGEQSGNAQYVAFGTRAVASHVGADGSIQGYKEDEYNIDNIPPGRVLLAALARGEANEAHTKAIKLLRHQMTTHPRTSEGGFWHKKRYPHQMWLDGVYMASPFLAQYAVLFKEPGLFDDVARQIVIMDSHSYDSATGLFWHAWDESKAQSWANPKTGASPNFWSRAIGWYGMAIVDTLDYLPVQQPEIDQIVNILKRLADGAVRWQDPKSGVWWQITNLGTREGNYLEASGSAMLVYTLAKAVNKGYLPREKYEAAILKGYQGLIDTFVRTNPDGGTSLTKICRGAGLGYTTIDGSPRDGSFDYYVREPIVDNDPKGTGPFLLAGIEVQKMLSGQVAERVVRGWDDYDYVISKIRPPQFPARDFVITDFGAAVTHSDNGDAIAQAISACHAAGGGRVLVPPGEWKTHPIQLASNVNLHVAEGATLKFIFNPAIHPIVLSRWEGIEAMNLSPLIYAHGQENIALTGGGTLDGQGAWDTWWAWNDKRSGAIPLQVAARARLIEMGENGTPVEQRRFGPKDYLRPNFIEPYNCRNILIEGVKIVRSPMWEVHPVLCTNVTVRGVRIDSQGPNNDGCDPDSCRDVLIENCSFSTGDDCIAIKSGRNTDGRRVGVASENLIVRGCTMVNGHGGVVIGSEISGGCRNVFIDDCTMDSPALDRALRFKSNARRGGVIENVFMRNVRIGRVLEAVLTVDLLYEEGADGKFPPVVRNIQLDGINSASSPRLFWIQGFPAATIDGIRVRNSVIRGVTAPDVLSGVGKIELQNVLVEPLNLGRSRSGKGSL